MKIAVVSYSLTGNNEALAKNTAEELAAEHIKITECKHRSMSTIILDLIFNRTPQVQPNPDIISSYDLLLLFGPVWMGKVASPLRSYLSYLKTNACKYAFVSISGGAIGPNPELKHELEKRAGREPIRIIDQHVADLLPSDPKPTLKVASAYRINSEEILKLTDTIVKTVREAVL